MSDDPAGINAPRLQPWLARRRAGISYWRVRLRSAPMLGFALFGQWDERSAFFRWRWRAKAAAWRHRLSAPKDVLTEAIIELYLPGANVVDLDMRRASRKHGG